MLAPKLIDCLFVVAAMTRATIFFNLLRKTIAIRNMKCTNRYKLKRMDMISASSAWLEKRDYFPFFLIFLFGSSQIADFQFPLFRFHSNNRLRTVSIIKNASLHGIDLSSDVAMVNNCDPPGPELRVCQSNETLSCEKSSRTRRSNQKILLKKQFRAM